MTLEPRQLGDPLGEQRRLAAGRAVLTIPTRDVVRVTGPDRLRFLDALLSRRVETVGDGGEALLLDAAGHIVLALGVLVREDAVLLLPDRGRAVQAVDWVGRMRFMLRVEARDETDQWDQIGWFAPWSQDGADPPAWVAGITSLAAAVWVDPWAVARPDGWQYSAATVGDRAAWTWRIALTPVAERTVVRDVLREAGVGRAGGDAWQALRIAAVRPRQADDVDERTIPHELDWLRTAVQLDRGCYPGQETVAKVHNLGHPPRRLVLLQLETADVWVEHGDPVLLNGAEVGRVTAGGVHWEMGGVALAVVRRTVPAGASIEVRHGDETLQAAQEIVVPAEAGGLAADRVRELRRARRAAR
ncbi:MAG: Folate-binding protein [Pseudoclavibacter caeni]|jgi:tRNA-modifying protein YgfZ